MKALAPPPPQLELLPRHRVLTAVEPSVRPEILRALAEVLLAAADESARREERDEAR